jgi:hypothetical protein
VLKKAIKQLLFMVVPYGETIGVKCAKAKGMVTKFERIDWNDPSGDTYSKYHLTVEFYPKYPPYTDFDYEDEGELQQLSKIPIKDRTPEQIRRHDYLKGMKKANFDRQNWKRFSRNVGAREVTVNFELDD